MRPTIPFVLLLVTHCFIACMTNQEDSQVEKLLSEAKSRLAPDKRTRIFNVRGSLKGNDLTLSGEVHSDEMKRQLYQFIKEEKRYRVVDSVEALPHASLGKRTFGVVGISVANMRVRPGHDEEMATQVLLGTTVRVLKQRNGWYLLQTPDEYLGWSDDMIELMTQEEYEQWSQKTKVIVTSTYGHAYRTKQRQETVSDIVAGNIFALLATDGKFFHVEYPNGKQGFVAKEDAVLLTKWLANAKDTPEALITSAKRFMGVPYLWGGTSTKALDCSGFTKLVFFLNGVLLPRDASQQALVGEPVSISDDFVHLKKGDLVFFGRKATTERAERVTHVGIYIDKYKFIHESGDVRINSFNPQDPDYSEFRTRSLLSAKRIIGVGEDRGVRRLASISSFANNEH